MNQIDQLIAAGMTALLADPDTKKAVLEYLAALTESAKPNKEETWRIVWEQLSEETREFAGKQYRLLLRSRYDATSDTAHVQASPVRAGYTLSRFRFSASDDFQPHFQYVEAKTVTHFTEAIRFGIERMKVAMAAWEAELELLNNPPTVNKEAFLRP